jgi:non-specific serine/threonine protein kinase
VVLSVEQIAARLDQRFCLLTGGSRVALPRQQTLAATVDWSYNLLSVPEQLLFARLAVFAGCFSLDAAEIVYEVPDGREPAAGGEAPANVSLPQHTPILIVAADVMDLLTRLIEKLLVSAEVGSDGIARYRLLETLRDYGRERLVVVGELDETRRRHAAYCLVRAEEASRHLQGSDQIAWLDRLERDHDNLRAALRWAIEREDARLGMRLAASLSDFWYLRGHFSEGRALRAAVLALPAGEGLAAPRAELLQGIGMLALRQGDYPAARAYLDEALTLARRCGAPRLLAAILATLGFVARVQDDYAAARPALHEALTLAREGCDILLTAMALHHLGLLALEAEGEVELAWSLNEQSLALSRQLGNRRMAAVVLGNMGRVARAQGNLARALLGETVTALRDVGDLGPMPQMLYTLAAVDADAGWFGRAVRLQAAAMQLEEVVGIRVWPANRRERDGWLEHARAAVGAARFAQAWAAGQAMTLEQAVAHALANNRREPGR